MTAEEQLIHEVREVHRHMADLVIQFPQDQREAILFDKWSLKDVLAHITAWNTVDAEHTERVRDGEDFEWISDWDAFNEQEVSKRKQLPWDALVKEWETSARRMATVFQNLPASVWDKRCGPENKSTPRGWLVNEISHYRDEHIPQVAKKIDELEK